MNENVYSLGELASVVGAEVHGDANRKIYGVAPLNTARAGQLSFLDNSKYKKYLANTQASAVILARKYIALCPADAIVTDNPYLAYAQIARLFVRETIKPAGIHATAVIGEGCRIADSVYIGPHCVVGDQVCIGADTVIHAGTVVGDACKIGEACKLRANVTLYDRVELGDRVEIHSGAVLGADGFGYAQSPEGFAKVPQMGTVIVGSDVDIGANTTIDRGAIDNTYIGNGVKIDNQVQIGHNAQIGDFTIIAGCAGIAGSTKIGKNCMIGGGAGIVGHIEITDNVLIAAMAGISKSITAPGIYAGGVQADKIENWRRNAIAFRHLGEMSARLKLIEEQLQMVTEK